MTKQTHPEHILAIESNNGDPQTRPAPAPVGRWAAFWTWIWSLLRA